MKKKRFSVEQITSVLQQVAAGVPVGDVCRQIGVSEQTCYRWKKEYDAAERSTRAEAVARREHHAEAARGRPVARQGHAAGCRPKKF